jgi:hypothetical protein
MNMLPEQSKQERDRKPARRIYSRTPENPGVRLFTDLVADDATDCCAANCPDRAAARKDGASDSTDAGTDCSALVTRRHPATASQAEQHCHGQRTGCKHFRHFHWNTSVSNVG